MKRRDLIVLGAVLPFSSPALAEPVNQRIEVLPVTSRTLYYRYNKNGDAVKIPEKCSLTLSLKLPDDSVVKAEIPECYLDELKDYALFPEETHMPPLYFNAERIQGLTQYGEKRAYLHLCSHLVIGGIIPAIIPWEELDHVGQALNLLDEARE